MTLKRMRNSTIAIISLLIGITSGFFFATAFMRSDKDTSRSASSQDNIESHCKNLIEASQVENQSDREALITKELGQIIKLLMVDIGLRLNSSSNLPDKLPTDELAKIKSDLATKEIPEKPLTTLSAKQETTTKYESQPKPDSLFKPDSKTIAEQIREFRTDEERKSFLDKISSSNISQHFEKIDLTAAGFRNFSGHYFGTLNPVKASEAPSEMKVHLKLLDPQKLVAQTEIVLSRNGTPYSESSGNGDIKGFSAYDSSQSSMVVEDCGGGCAFHFFRSYEGHQLFGNYYRKENKTWVRAGTFLLEKL